MASYYDNISNGRDWLIDSNAQYSAIIEIS